jgi:hypothetical protein
MTKRVKTLIAAAVAVPGALAMQSAHAWRGGGPWNGSGLGDALMCSKP